MSLLQPLSGPSWSFVPLRGYRFSLSVFLRGPSRTPFESFPTPWSPFADPLPDLWQAPLELSPTPSWPFAVLRGPSWISFCPFLEIFSPCPTFGRSFLSLLQPLSGPSWSFVPLRGYLFVLWTGPTNSRNCGRRDWPPPRPAIPRDRVPRCSGRPPRPCPPPSGCRCRPCDR